MIGVLSGEHFGGAKGNSQDGKMICKLVISAGLTPKIFAYQRKNSSYVFAITEVKKPPLPKFDLDGHISDRG